MVCYYSYYDNKCLSAKEAAYVAVRHNYYPRFPRQRNTKKSAWRVRFLRGLCGTWGELAESPFFSSWGASLLTGQGFRLVEWGDGEGTGGNLESEVKSLSHVRLFATPWTVAYQAPQSVGFSRQEYWSGLPFPSPEDLPHPGIEPGSPAL